MIWLFTALSVVVSFVIAAVTVGWVVERQASRARVAVYDLDAAVHYVADRLSEATTAELSYDDVADVLGWHLDELRERGVASFRSDEAPGDALVVVDEAEPVARILARIDGTDRANTLTDDRVVEILATHDGYLRSIGAVGPPADAPPLPAAGAAGPRPPPAGPRPPSGAVGPAVGGAPATPEP